MKAGSGDLPTSDPYLRGHGDPSWSATGYDLDLDYAVATNRLQGQATITAVAERETGRIVLDLAGLGVDKVSVTGAVLARYATRSNRLVLTLRYQIAAGTEFRVTVRYSGKPVPLIDRHHGDAGWEELTDGVIVAGQPHGAPTWFPCNDRPDDKARYRISVTTQPDYTVVANGTLVSRTRHGSSVTWVHRQDAPMASYLATVQIGRYEMVDLDAVVPMRAAIPPGSSDGFAAAFGDQPEMMAAFTAMFGPYPFECYVVVVTADELEIPLESQGLSTFGVNFLNADWDSVRLVAHELAHQWFGNAVTLKSWRDIWLHEGFACYSEWLWSEASGLDSADTHARNHHRRLSGLDQNLLLADPSPEMMFDDRVYKRGALTLHAVRLQVGDVAFFDLLKGWVSTRSGGSVTTAEFREFAIAQTGVELDQLFTDWLDRTALPDLPAAS
ncbi:M1 family metallopeptidase [soil metagenome]